MLTKHCGLRTPQCSPFLGIGSAADIYIYLSLTLRCYRGLKSHSTQQAESHHPTIWSVIQTCTPRSHAPPKSTPRTTSPDHATIRIPPLPPFHHRLRRLDRSRTLNPRTHTELVPIILAADAAPTLGTQHLQCLPGLCARVHRGDLHCRRHAVVRGRFCERCAGREVGEGCVCLSKAGDAAWAVQEW